MKRDAIVKLKPVNGMELAAMDTDAMKAFGFGDCPDWRWRRALRHVKRIGEADTPAEYFTGPGEEALLEDETLTRFAFPYLKRHFHPEAGHGMPAERMAAMTLALGAANEEFITPKSDSLNLEAGILGGRPEGDLLAVRREFTPMAQFVYERMFYDVRPFLGDAATVCRLVFRDRERRHGRGGFDLICKITAYGLGFDEYRMWREGSPSDKAGTLHAAMNDLLRYVDGLQLLGIDAPDDMEMAFVHFFAILPEILARRGSGTGGKRGYHAYTRDEMTAMAEMLPKGEPVAV